MKAEKWKEESDTAKQELRNKGYGWTGLKVGDIFTTIIEQ